MDLRNPGEQSPPRDPSMRALVIDRAGSAALREISEPTPAPDEVLLRVRTVGFCGSDLNTYRGLNPLVSYPRVPGHEIAATVDRIGTDVPSGRFREGMLVTVVPYTACGRCPAGTEANAAQTSCVICPPGEWSPGDGVACRALPARTSSTARLSVLLLMAS